MPCPISACGMTRVVLPVLSMRMKAFAASWPSGWSGSCSGSLTGAALTGQSKARTRLPAKLVLTRPRRERPACWFTDMASSSRLAAHALDGFADTHVGAATAYIAGHRRIDIGVVGMRVLGNQRSRRHDLTRLAVAALDHFKVEPGLLHVGAGLC